MGRVISNGEGTRQLAIQALEESRSRGDTARDALRHLSKRLHMGVPAARCVRDYLIRHGHWSSQ